MPLIYEHNVLLPTDTILRVDQPPTYSSEVLAVSLQSVCTSMKSCLLRLITHSPKQAKTVCVQLRVRLRVSLCVKAGAGCQKNIPSVGGGMVGHSRRSGTLPSPLL